MIWRAHCSLLLRSRIIMHICYDWRAIVIIHPGSISQGSELCALCNYEWYSSTSKAVLLHYVRFVKDNPLFGVFYDKNRFQYQGRTRKNFANPCVALVLNLNFHGRYLFVSSIQKIMVPRSVGNFLSILIILSNVSWRHFFQWLVNLD